LPYDTVTFATEDPAIKEHYETRRILQRPPEKPELSYVMMNQKRFEAKGQKEYEYLCRGIDGADSKGSIRGAAVPTATSAN
jgi:hypothetical protein